MKVSIIIPAYKAEKYLARCLDSLINQTFKDWDAYVMLDNPDNDPTVLREYWGRDHRIKGSICNKKTSPAKARNSGISLSDPYAEYICLLDADDYWLPEKLEMQVYYMDEFRIPGYTWTHGAILEGSHKHPVDSTDRPMFTSSLMFRKIMLDRIKVKDGYYFDPSLKQSDDVDLLLRLKDRGILGECVHTMGIVQENRPDGLTNKCWWKCLITHNRIAIKNGRYWDAVHETYISPYNILKNKIIQRFKPCPKPDQI